MAVQQQLSDLDLFLLTTLDDTEDAPWIVMADLQVRERDLLIDILRLHVLLQRLPWYLASYLKVTMPRPAGRRTLAAAPDLLMALADDEPRTSWDIVSEGQAPRFVLEVSSAASWERDSEDKPLIYQAMGVREYVVFAPERKDGGPVLFGYRLDEGGQYRALGVDEQGVLWSQELGGLGLCVEERVWLRARDAQGNRLPTPTELFRTEASARAAEAVRAGEAVQREFAVRSAEIARREAAEAEVARLREELRRLREG